MQVDSVQVRLPSRVVSNQEVLAMLREHSQSTFEGDLEETLAAVERTLIKSGSNTRRWLGDDERPIDLLCEAFDAALEEAEVQREEIDLLIYVGVGRGFVEPAGAYLVAHALGMPGVECFDLLDACMSWIRALSLAHDLLKVGRYRRIALVNQEFNVRPGGMIRPNFTLRRPQDLAWTFPSYTLGEASSVTLLSASDKVWDFNYSARTDLAPLCTIPLNNFGLFCKVPEAEIPGGSNRFTSFGGEMHREGWTDTVAIFEALGPKRMDLDVIFTHASSKYMWDKVATHCGVAEKVHHIYQDTGNLVSASVPAAMVDAMGKGALKRGDDVGFWVGSAGMSFASVRFQY